MLHFAYDKTVMMMCTTLGTVMTHHLWCTLCVCVVRRMVHDIRMFKQLSIDENTIEEDAKKCAKYTNTNILQLVT